MKKIKLTKVIASSLIVASVLALSPIPASAEWKQNNTGWWYTEGSSWATGWRLVDGKWYYFNENGYMAHDTVIDGYKVGSNGAWIQNSVLATVGDEKITKDELDKQMSKYDAQLKEEYGDNYATNATVKDEITKIKKQQLDNMIIEKVFLKKAVELNLNPSDTEINQQITVEINQYKSQYTEEAEYENALKQSGMTEDELRKLIRTSIIANVVQQKMLRDMLKDITVEDNEIQTYYNQNKATKFTLGAGATVAHILVADEEKAKNLKAKLDAGADFATLAKENSIDPGTKDSGGSLGFIQYNSTQFITEFMNGFKNLKEGEVSEPVMSKFGYHLIKATGLKRLEMIRLNEVEDEIKVILLQQKQESIFVSKVEEWKTDLKVKTYYDQL